MVVKSYQVATVNSLIALSNDSSHTKEEGTLGRPVPAGPAPVVLAGEHDEVGPGLPVLLSSVEDIQDVVGRDVQRLGSSLPNQLVDLHEESETSTKSVENLPVGCFQRCLEPLQHHCLVEIRMN